MIGRSKLCHKKIGMIYGTGWGMFTNDLIDHFRKNENEVRTPESNWASEYEDIIAWADLVWLEWANEQTMHATNNIKILQGKPTICRIHGYELFYGFLSRINWKAVTRAVFVSDYMKRLAARACPEMFQQTRPLVIPNGVDLDKFPLTDRAPGFNLAVVGNVAEKKNPALWVEIASRLKKIDPRYTILVAGELKEIKTRLYLDHIIGKLNLGQNVIYHGFVNDIPGWFEKENISYILSTSYFESFGYSIAEGMAMGCRPLIFNYPGAEETWPTRFLFRDVDELVGLIQQTDGFDSPAFRRFIEEHYSLARQMKQVDAMMDDML